MVPLLSDVLSLPERAPGRTIASIGLLLALVYTAALIWLPRPDGRLVAGDAVHYYVYLRSGVFDRDLHFLNDYVGLATGIPDAGHDGPEWLAERTATGHIRNVMSVGPAMAWTPLFLAVTAMVWLGRSIGFDWPLDGLWWPFQASVAYSGIAAATLAAYVTFRLCTRVASTRAAIWATSTMWLGSHALYYSLVAPQYSHAISMCVSSIFFLYWMSTTGRFDVPRWFTIGLLGGLTALVRWQDVLVLGAPLVELGAGLLSGSSSPTDVGGSARRRATLLMACGAGALVALGPQFYAWQVIFGQPFLIPQGSGFMQWTAPHLWDVLFSAFRGLFTWTPVIALGVAGVWGWSRHERTSGAGVWLVLLAGWYANAAVADWWAGEAFGGRRFLGNFPLFALGLAWLAGRLGSAWPLPRLVTCSAIVVGLNALLLLQYQAFMHGLRALVPYPDNWQSLLVARFIVPFTLAKHWWPW